MTILDDVREALRLEIEALQHMAENVGEEVGAAVELLLDVKGRVIFTGMGKAGHVARKLAATFSSTGTPSLFMHPGEAYHGDLGIITGKDVAVILSNSGETEEVIRLLPCFKRFQVPCIALTGNAGSTLARNCDVVLNTGVEREACPLNCAPTSSTTTAMAMGDALACALITARGFKQEDFALFHPGGTLGVKLLATVDEFMAGFDASPVVSPETSLREAVVIITEKRMGAVVAVDDARKVVGIFTDGDLRRLLFHGETDLHVPVKEVMTSRPAVTAPDVLAAGAVAEMERRKITVLPVVDEDGRLLGCVQLHKLLEAGLV
jgi:arabinose-5-phosphate isomerase